MNFLLKHGSDPIFNLFFISPYFELTSISQLFHFHPLYSPLLYIFETEPQKLRLDEKSDRSLVFCVRLFYHSLDSNLHYGKSYY